MFDTEKLIRCVRANPAIWNRRSKEYRNRLVRQKSWTLVGKRMYKNWDSLSEKDKDHKVYGMRNRWRHVRDAYARHVNRDTTIGGKNRRKYIYADTLAFLPTEWSSSPTPNEAGVEEDNKDIETESDESDDSTQDHMLSSGSQQIEAHDGLSQADPLEQSDILAFQPSSSSDANLLVKSEPIVEEIIDPDLADSTQYSVCSEQSWKKSRTTQLATFSSQMSALEELEVFRQIEADPDRAFLLSLLPDLKRLNNDEKLEFRIHMLQFIKNIQQKRKLNNSDQLEETLQSGDILRKANSVKVEYDEEMEGKFLNDSRCA
nr:unnamed protein product [Callosobruchus chinensis]